MLAAVLLLAACSKTEVPDTPGGYILAGDDGADCSLVVVKKDGSQVAMPATDCHFDSAAGQKYATVKDCGRIGFGPSPGAPFNDALLCVDCNTAGQLNAGCPMRMPSTPLFWKKL